MDRLGLVIIDEQHKFGVAQRETLVRKGRYPHLLVMTATPIPRTLGLTLYGDLDISAIDEVPAGRGQVRTFVRGPEQLPRVHEFMKQKIAEGRQAYVVYPRVEEADLRTGAKAVAKEFERLQSVFSPHRVGLLHGRLRPEEKERVMADFRANRVQVLLATSVIEVGIDVPNATMLLVENAEHFGLAQLHQLRGRIGRGAHESWCILVAEQKTDEAKERLKVLAATNDGFAIAEADLRLRGPGDLLGQQQSGMPALRFGDLARDRAIIERAKELVAGQDGVGKS
jgi:ATP-dependent DNA helicase RecG